MSELPQGWAETTLGEVADWGSGGTPSRSEPSFYGGTIPWIKSGELNSRYVTTTEEFITEAAIKNSSAKLFPAGSVAIAMYGATIGKTAILGVDASTNQACAVGAPVEGVIGKEFLYRLLQNEKESFIEKGKGGAQPNISQAVIKAHEISLPPLAEQTRITQKLDELLAQVDTIKARIDTIPALLKRLRQSVFAVAVSGRLTEKWRSPLDTSKPQASWKNCKIGDISSLVTSGSRGWADYYSDNGAIFIRSQDINTDELEISDTAFVRLPESSEGKRTRVQDQDILITITGANVGKVARVKQQIPEAYVSQHVALVRLNKPEFAPFIELYLKDIGSGRGVLLDLAYGGGKPGLNLSNIRDLLLPIPPIGEQIEIVRRVEQLFAFADQLEAKVATAQNRIDLLTQSILARAFRGKLVPQDLNDEPASVLLERIKAKRTVPSKAKRGSKSV